MKLPHKQDHDPVRMAAFEILCDFEKSPSPLPDIIEARVRRENFTSRDRAFVSNLVYGVIRFREQLDYIIGRYLSDRKTLRNRKKAALLRLGAFQLMPDSRVPHAAAIDETVKLTRALLSDGLTGFVNAVLRKIASASTIWDSMLPDGRTAHGLAVRFSQPSWIIETLSKDLGRSDAIRCFEAFGERLKITLRVNRLRTSHEDFEHNLRTQEISFERSGLHGDYYHFPYDTDIAQLDEIRAGLCFVQNISSGMVTELLSPSPEIAILDMCAAPGGKTAAIAMITGDPDNITAIEVDAVRFDRMKQNFARLSLTGIECIHADAMQYTGKNYDAVLVDAPCSGLGTIAKHPEVKYIQDPTNVRKLAESQSELLAKAAELVKPGGHLTYSVCTLTSAETIGVLDKFLELNPKFSLDVPVAFRYHQFIREPGYMLILPEAAVLEGMFTFRVRKEI